MTIIFDSWCDKLALSNALIFAQHSKKQIEEMETLHKERGAQMRNENKKWNDLYIAMDGVKPGEAFTFNGML